MPTGVQFGFGVHCTNLAYAGNAPGCLPLDGTSCSAVEKERIKRWMKINKTKIH